MCVFELEGETNPFQVMRKVARVVLGYTCILFLNKTRRLVVGFFGGYQLKTKQFYLVECLSNNPDSNLQIHHYH